MEWLRGMVEEKQFMEVEGSKTATSRVAKQQVTRAAFFLSLVFYPGHPSFG